ncbi:MAG: four helix bundle protein [Bacteroidetes bacterium HGW-Bacteroidetes-15]|nr:MAG: four helix bundle protein [Bacteroidetes bacterium HGW-Bacteroidetes-23]PKP36120.1 MAG: four helix bundle protein [Bacteroidetes bacterium HGW-Bacteroidetes-15]
MKENVIKTKSYAFALRVIKLYKFLCEEKREFVLSKQLLRSGTSVGANIEEADAGQSKRDFIAKLQISLKEAKESHYWIRLLKDSDFIDEKMAVSFLTDCNEIIAILTSILKSAKNANDEK